MTTTGKGKYGDRPSKTVRLIDRDTLTAAALRVLEAIYGQEGADAMHYKADPIIIAKYKGAAAGMAEMGWDYAIVCSEGVGYVPDNYGRIEIDLWNGNGVCTSAPLHLSTLLKMPYTLIDLADHVRVFGDRLEQNHALWHNRLIASSENGEV